MPKINIKQPAVPISLPNIPEKPTVAPILYPDKKKIVPVPIPYPNVSPDSPKQAKQVAKEAASDQTLKTEIMRALIKEQVDGKLPK